MKMRGFLLMVLLFLFQAAQLIAQCPMCKASAEANIKEGGTKALGLNAGIIYLFLTPYIIVITIAGIFYYKNVYKKKKDLLPA
jgi:hypothetical protein